MKYPGYQLNPGDMFQVEPERVLFATGAPKDARERRAGRVARRKAQSSKDPDESSSDPPTTTANDQPSPQPEAPSEEVSTKETLKSLLSQARTFLAAPSSSPAISAKRKQDLRAFQRTLKRALSRSNDIFPQKATNLTDSIDAQLQELTQKLNLNPPPPPPENEKERAAAARDLGPETLTLENSSLLRQALAEARENPIDATKTYATPWRPRPYMSAFAFIPRFLEVHHRVCSAVYLRHPVARPGLAEVPTPFGNDTNALAHNWYLRRR